MKILLIVSMILVFTLLGIQFTVPVLAHSPNDEETTKSTGIYLDQTTLTQAAQSPGLTQEELLPRLEEGESISEIAANRNIPEDQVVEALIIPYQDELQLQMKYCYISQEQADVLLEQVRVHARDLLMLDDSNELTGNFGKLGSSVMGVRG